MGAKSNPDSWTSGFVGNQFVSDALMVVEPTAGYTQGSVKNSFDWRLRIGNISALK